MSARSDQLVFGKSRTITALLDQCERFARSPRPLLILGEPGTGKTALAKHIHNASRRSGRFIKDAASSIPDQLELSHLCGHAKGAFTGASFERMGLIEAAHDGTFFLDELGEASARVQQVLRQLLEDGVVRRVGDLRERPVNVRFLAATNADLESMVEAGSFRRDLHHRFGFLVIRVPRLADRPDEILPLVDFYLQLEARAVGCSDRPVLSDDLKSCLCAAPWRGNIRELENLCAYMYLKADPGEQLGMAHLPPEFLASMGAPAQRRHERSILERATEALQQTQGNKAAAARVMGISRRHLHRLLARPRPDLMEAV